METSYAWRKLIIPPRILGNVAFPLLFLVKTTLWFVLKERRVGIGFRMDEFPQPISF